MRRILTHEWVPLNRSGTKWVYYMPGEQGCRNASGYVLRRAPKLFEAYLSEGSIVDFLDPVVFDSMEKAATYLYERASLVKGK